MINASARIGGLTNPILYSTQLRICVLDHFSAPAWLCVDYACVENEVFDGKISQLNHSTIYDMADINPGWLHNGQGHEEICIHFFSKYQAIISP
jgi:hypothetical protein